MSSIPFDQRACFVAGPAKSGTTLLVALLDNHPELLAFPEETAYFPTVLTKYGPRGRSAQFDYLTKHAPSRGLFGVPRESWKQSYAEFPTARFLNLFEQKTFAPENAGKDLLVLMIEAYAETIGRPLDSIRRWIEKTPANRKYLPQIRSKFSHAKILLTLRDPRAILAAQIALKKTRELRRFSVYYVIAHWRESAQLALRAQRGQLDALVVQFEQLVGDPRAVMQKVCAYLDVSFDPDIVLQPTKAGALWRGNSAVEKKFSEISAEPATRWRRELSQDEIGWIEWHCRDLMAQFGYEPQLRTRALRHWLKPIRGENAREYLKSRAYSLRDDWRRR